jgi:ribulose 1,5-bisphosphate synthetase/thiazole synthase
MAWSAYDRRMNQQKSIHEAAAKGCPNSQVLIIGAGPTGLTAAAILAKLGTRVRIIDKNLNRSDKSKALGVQAGHSNVSKLH